MKFSPHPYQLRAIEWVKAHERCCLFLDMGLGKTASALTAASELMDCCEISSVLVIAPKKVAESTWADEAKQWDHLKHLRVSVAVGTEAQRAKALEAEADIYVTNRDSAAWMAKRYNGAFPFDMVIVDELTSFKNHKSIRFKALSLCTKRTPRLIGLTGTPAPNGLADLWAQMYVVDQGESLGRRYTRYIAEHFDVVTHNHIPIKKTIKKGHEEIINKAIAPICLTMKAEDYLKLPPMMEHVVRVRLSEKALKAYREMEREKVLEFCETDGKKEGQALAVCAAALMNKLSQIANGAVYDQEGEARELHSDKLDALKEIAEAAAEQGESLLVFYQYKHDAARICDALKAYSPKVYEGAEDLAAWNQGRIKVLLAHPASTAYGLNMQRGGRLMAWFGTGWNLELYQQACARLHRQGQQKPVVAYLLVSAGTVDERALSALQGKKSQQEALMEGLKQLIKEHGKR